MTTPRPKPDKILITHRVLELAARIGLTPETIEECYYHPEEHWELHRDGEYDGEVLVRGKLALIVSAEDRVVATLPARKALRNRGLDREEWV